MIQKVIIVFIALLCALTGKAGDFWMHPYPILSLGNLTDYGKGGNLEYSLMFMQNSWFGVGVGLGFAVYNDVDDLKNTENLQILDSEVGGTGVILDISAVFSPKIGEIGKRPVYLEVMPSLRLSPRQKLQYGYADSGGMPVRGYYKNPWLCGVLTAGIAVNVYKRAYIRFGYVGTNGQNANLKVDYDEKGVPRFQSGIKHDIYLSVGFRL